MTHDVVALNGSLSLRVESRLAKTVETLRSSWLTSAGLAIVLVIIFVGCIAPLLSHWDPTAPELVARLEPPTQAHILGTDSLGRDTFARILHGTQITLIIVALVSAVAGPIGLAVGVVTGYFGGWIDAVLMRITDIFMAFPRLLLALAVAAALGPGLVNAVIAIVITSWPAYARIARAEAFAFRRADFIAAARLRGIGSARLLLHHIVPLCLPSLLVRLTFDMAGVILTAAGLGFLGLGAQPPAAEWGSMVASGRDFITEQWWVSTFPGLAIFIASLGFSLLGDGLRDLLDPKLRS